MNKRLWPKRLPELPYPYWEEFQASAKVHDINYDHKYKPRDEADFKFLLSCLEDAAEYEYPKRERMIFVAYIYYVLVRVFGRISFLYATKLND